jgi:hypothetical protein
MLCLSNAFMVAVWTACTVCIHAQNSEQTIAQNQAGFAANANDFPNAPLPRLELQSSSQQTSVADGSAVIRGIVSDASGATIVGARVSLTNRDGDELGTLVSGDSGQFVFSKLPTGAYLVTVILKGFARFASGELTISSQQQVYAISNIVLAVGSATSEIKVYPAEVIAAQQIKAEEQQRLLGVLPNFYVSYVHDAAPLSTKQKFSLATHDTLDWTSWVGISITAGIEQANNSYGGMDRAMQDTANVGPHSLATVVQVTI